ncbi:GGDEF domain-containing protein [Pelagibacterium montanilacus]|uniref:GGDEF domain-containing protein n=1 Tax=Pelagibacterium montanilacus TaxID=2185280 RepID=UPI000F8E7432|nr:GGDEF domain-containing protein [Pelagibacterium montanilacus]
MAFDYGSVLLAVGAAGTALCFTLTMNWLRQRAAGFLLTWALAIGIIVASVVMFSVFAATSSWLHGLVACLLLVLGFAVNHAGMVHFRDGQVTMRPLLLVAALMWVPLSVANLVGMDGIAFWMVNFMCAGLITATGLGYWLARSESETVISMIAMLHWLMAFSFFLCGLVAIVEQPFHLSHGMPENWAEVFNLVCAVVTITGVGGLMITVYQERISRRHQDDALTDPLTGLRNRRALFRQFGERALARGTGLVVFDLDDFKGLNDRYGHGFGDEVLQRFAALLETTSGANCTAVRLGGEEFALTLTGVSLAHAAEVAERVRVALEGLVCRTADELVSCTVSAGVAVTDDHDTTFDRLLSSADTALYLSKRNGRNRVTAPASLRAA